MKNTILFSSPLGFVGISELGGFITDIFFENDAECDDLSKTTPLLESAKKQLLEYFSGNLQTFDLPIKENGTDFQRKVWEALRKIPYGETRSYKQVAEMIGNPKASRAVGMANNKNPIAIVTPCHRVIGSSGKLVGYAGGLDIKEKLLQLEKINGSF